MISIRRLVCGSATWAITQQINTAKRTQLGIYCRLLLAGAVSAGADALRRKCHNGDTWTATTPGAAPSASQRALGLVVTATSRSITSFVGDTMPHSKRGTPNASTTDSGDCCAGSMPAEHEAKRCRPGSPSIPCCVPKVVAHRSPCQSSKHCSNHSYVRCHVRVCV